MEPLFTFLGSYWWLIFPFMGVMGAAGNAWQRAVKQRHKRRLEILKAKSELRAAGATGRVPRQAAVGPGANREQTLQRLFDAHDEVTRRWLSYELDVAKLIAFPAMSDGRQPLTASFLRARKVADRLRPASTKEKIDQATLAEYREAVDDYEVAFDVAEKDARRLRDTAFSEIERRRLDTAKQLLSVAIDQAATPAERQLAYRRVRQELDGLISLSDEAVEVLEQKVALELTTGPVRAPNRTVTDGGSADRPPASEPRPRVAPPPESATRPVRRAHPSPHSGGGQGAWPVPSRTTKPPTAP